MRNKNMNSVLQFGGDLSQRLSLDMVAYPDANNNGDKMSPNVRGDKYSLRPRSLRRGVTEDDEIQIPTTAVATSTTTTSKSRSVKQQKPKQKPAPLSKYRRKTANARERSRMREINAAFEALRRAVPHLQQCTGPAAAAAASASAAANEKLTKITTLRLAMKYISALSSALRDPSSSANSSNSSTVSSTATLGSTCGGSDLGDLLSDCSDLDCLFLESDGESLQLHSDISDHSLTPADFATDFPDNSPVSVDFGDSSFSPTFPENSLSPFDTFFTDFS